MHHIKQPSVRLARLQAPKITIKTTSDNSFQIVPSNSPVSPTTTTLATAAGYSAVAAQDDLLAGSQGGDSDSGIERDSGSVTEGDIGDAILEDVNTDSNFEECAETAKVWMSLSLYIQIVLIQGVSKILGQTRDIVAGKTREVLSLSTILFKALNIKNPNQFFKDGDICDG